MDEAVQQMEALRSYRMVIVDHARPLSVPHAVRRVVDIDRDRGYRMVAEMVDGLTALECEDVPGGEKCEPQPPATVEDAGVMEFVVLEDRIYVRECVEVDYACDEWSSDELHYLWYPMTGPGWFMPEYPLFAVAGAGNVEPVGDREDAGGIFIRGDFDVLETLTASLDEFREKNIDVPGFEEAVIGTSDRQLQQFSADLLPLEVVIDGESGLLRRVSMFLPSSDLDSDGVLYEVEISFSHFDEVTVERPH